ncbi:HNH endonuclease [Fusibacter sp. 3D3]|uniref:HNH endonuclease n=1 Tax=Fusibacter sp. 3D3 TaxID=1048380 RepID=UPI00085328AF|nr:HNH endonuclease [Fusibacter sp. 3D3]GAU76535.1 hypothetical protein F3D3_1132 [Fusibacter sp. 3D3]
MIPIKVKEESAMNHYSVIEKHLKIITKKGKTKYSYYDLERWVQKITKDEFDLKSLITAKPEKLSYIKNLVEDNPDYKLDGKDKGKRESDYEHGKYFECIYAKFSSSSDTHFSTYDYNALKLIEDLNLKVCPYCNRNFITNTERTSKQGNPSIIRTAQLDHFYPKSEYPYLALSFYNLIPVCPSCNKNKHVYEMGISPYEMKSSDDHLIFDYGFDGSVGKYKVKVSYKSEKFETNEKVLGLEALYKVHDDYCDDLILRIKIYNESYNDDLQGFFRKLDGNRSENNLSESDVKRLILGNYFEEDDLQKHPLSKLTKDIFQKYG